MEKNKRIETVVTDGIICLFGCFLVWILVLLFWKADSDYMCKKNFAVYNGWAVVLLGANIALSLFAKSKGIGSGIAAFCDEHIGLFWGIVFVAQIYVFQNIYFETGWDAHVIISADISNHYYQMYPNNIVLAWFAQNVLRLNDAVGINFGQYRLMPLIILNCGISSFVGRLVHFIVKKLCGIRWAMAGCVIYFLLAAISPWNVIPYSDSFGLLFPALIYALYISDTGKVKKGAGILILTYIGYIIKPQCAIILIAIAIVEVSRGDFCRKFSENLRAVKTICAITILVVPAMSLFLNIQYRCAGYTEQKNAQFGFSHFLMMGLNEEYNGVYASEDVNFSQSQPTKALRTRENIRVSIDRVKNMGPVGLAKHLSKKLLVIFNDGTFAWGAEGNFYAVLKDDVNNRISPLLKNIYYNHGSRHALYGFIIQQIWVMLLLGIAVCMPLIRTIAQKNKQIQVVILTLLGLILFELIFEARARYLYIYVPLFVVAFIAGMHTLLGRITRKGDLSISTIFYRSNK